MPNHLVIAGACVRQHVQSAQRAGFDTVGIDLFADSDTRDSGTSLKAKSTGEIPKLLGEQVRQYWCLAGGLERHAAQLTDDHISGKLLGSSPAALELASDFPRWSTTIKGAKLISPEHSRQQRCPPGHWLRKPLHSSGGHNIAWTERGRPRDQETYFQQWTPGRTLGATYITIGQQTELIGVTLQLSSHDIGRDQHPFAYAGSIGPLQLKPELQSRIRQIGNQIGQSIPCKGVWGADLISHQEKLTLVDINPRLTSSCDIHERAHSNLSIVGLHANACLGLPTMKIIDQLLQSPRIGLGKAIAFSPSAQPIEIKPSDNKRICTPKLTEHSGAISDIPLTGTVIPPQGPICTAYETEQNTTLTFDSSGKELTAGIQRILDRLKRRIHEIIGPWQSESKSFPGANRESSRPISQSG